MPSQKNSWRSEMKPLGDGFTLIELMVAIAIMGILASVAYPSYIESVRKAKRVEGRAALLQLMQQQERIYSQKNSYEAFSAAAENNGKFKWFSANAPASSAYEIRGEACSGEVIGNCVLLTATPGTSKVDANFQDPLCGTLTLTSTGTKLPETAGCWR